MRDELENRFKYHPASTQEVKDAHANVRKAARDACETILSYVPEDASRERAVVERSLEDAMMYANAGIARWSAAVVQPTAPSAKGAKAGKK